MGKETKTGKKRKDFGIWIGIGIKKDDAFSYMENFWKMKRRKREVGRKWWKLNKINKQMLNSR